MKQAILFFFSALVTIALSANNSPISGPGDVDVEKSEVSWTGYKVTGKHTGNVKLASGQLTMDNGALTGGTFTLDMSSIECTDLQGGGAQKLVGHLKSADFFSTDEFPQATFSIKSVVPTEEGGNYQVTGDLTIKGITHSNSFPITLADAGDHYTAAAAITVDRTLYDVKYGSGKFFENLGDKTIYDDFDIAVNLHISK